MPDREVKIRYTVDTREVSKAKKEIDALRTSTMALASVMAGSSTASRNVAQQAQNVAQSSKGVTKEINNETAAYKDLYAAYQYSARAYQQAAEASKGTEESLASEQEQVKQNYEAYQQSATAYKESAEERQKAADAVQAEIDAAKDAIKENQDAQKVQNEQVKASEKQAQQFKVVTGTISQMRSNLRELQAALYGLRDSTGQISEENRTYAESIRKAIFAQQQLISKVKDTQQGFLSVDWNRVIGSFVAWRLVINTASRALSAFAQGFQEAFADIHTQSESFKDLQSSVKETQYAIVAMIAPVDDVRNVFEFLADGVRAFGQVFVLTGAAITQQVTFWSELIRQFNIDFKTLLLGSYKDAIFELNRLSQTIDVNSASAAASAKAYEAWKQAVAGGAEAMQMGADAARDSSEEEKKFSKTLDAVRTSMQRFNDEASRHEQALTDIAAKYEELRRANRGEFALEQIKIEQGLIKDLDKINTDAAKARRKAEQDAAKALAKARQQAYKDLERQQEQHNLQMYFARRQFDLQNIQSERLYQYERGQLVADGDVLAIEELDARYELEKQAREENFQLQQAQAEALFQLQMKYQKQAAEEQIKAVKDALAEQLAAIEESRAEREAEARAAAAEEQSKLIGEYATEHAALVQAEADALAEEEASHSKRLAELAKFWAEHLAETNIELGRGIALFNKVMGTNGELNALIISSYSNQAQLTRSFVNDWKAIIGEIPQAAIDAANAANAALGSIGAGIGGGYGGGTNYGRRPGTPVRRYQFGGETVVSSPTPFLAGERGRERVIVQPLGALSMGGNMSLQWSGGAIPVRGEGSMTGLDMQSLADGITTSVFNRLSTVLHGRHGIRGR